MAEVRVLPSRKTPIKVRTGDKALVSWQNRGVDDLDLLTTIFWSAGVSRHVLAERLDYSKSKANAMVAALLEAGAI